MSKNLNSDAQSELFSNKFSEDQNTKDTGSHCLRHETISQLVRPTYTNKNAKMLGRSAETLPNAKPRDPIAGLASAGSEVAVAAPSTSENNSANTSAVVSKRQQNSNRVPKLSKRERPHKSRLSRELAVKTEVAPSKSSAHSEHVVLFFCVDRVARRYDVSVASIWRWIKEGRFPSGTKLTNGTTRWSRSILEAYERGKGASK